MRLLIVGDPQDLTSVYLGYRAGLRGLDVQVLDESRFGIDWAFEIDEADANASALIVAGERIGFGELLGAYVRFTPAPGVPATLEGDPGLAEVYARERRSALHLLLSRLAAPVANQPGFGQANGSKPLQMAQLQAAGFEVPRWIASNEPDRVEAFNSCFPEGTIVKSCSGTRSEVRLFDEDLTRKLAAGSPPVIVQQRIEGTDVRLHVVGERGFATSIEAGPGVDYRFDATRRRYAAIRPPDAVLQAAVAFAREQGLLIAGLDFRVSPSDRWWCLECNPAPTFLPYEMETGQAIADALLELMIAARN